MVDIFLDATKVHGIPSRIRGDHGTENVLVAAFMESLKGVERGSYIWGRLVVALSTVILQYLILCLNRSVHNVRIERLWRDLTEGLGAKWKNFFYTLELHDGLDRDSDSHMWLLHYLFLNSINQEAQAWAGAWNDHTLTIRGERQRSPRDMFFFGMIEKGMRGFEDLGDNDDTEEVEDLDSYGIDWEAYEDDTLLTHHNIHNPAVPGSDSENPFQTHSPRHLSHVVVENPKCPFNGEQLTRFVDALNNLSVQPAVDMDGRRLLWVSALEICNSIYSDDI